MFNESCASSPLSITLMAGSFSSWTNPGQFKKSVDFMSPTSHKSVGYNWKQDDLDKWDPSQTIESKSLWIICLFDVKLLFVSCGRLFVSKDESVCMPLTLKQEAAAQLLHVFLCQLCSQPIKACCCHGIQMLWFWSSAVQTKKGNWAVSEQLSFNCAKSCVKRTNLWRIRFPSDKLNDTWSVRTDQGSTRKQIPPNALF